MATPNITDLLKLAEALRAGAPVSVMPEIQPGTIPTGDYPDLLETKWDNSDLGRYTPSMFDPEGRYIREALEMTPDTLRTPTVKNPNAPKPPERMEQRPANPVFTTPYQHEGQYTPTPKQDTAQPTPTTTPTQPQNNDLESGYENYLKLFEKTLGDKPELDKKRRNQLAIVAGINALGQALRQVVDYTGRVKHGAPIYPQKDALTPALLAQYEQEGEKYQQRKDKYDLMKTNTMQQALQYAYGDQKAREQYEKQLDLLGKQQGFSEKQTDKEIAARQKLAEDQAKMVSERDDKQYQQDLEKLRKQFQYESSLIAQRADDALKAVKEKYGFQQGAKVAAELAKKSLPVVDQDPNKPIVIPPQIYLDVLQKQIALQNQDFTEFLTSTDFNATNNAGDIMVARYWKDFYTPVYDEAGNVVTWETKGAKYEGAHAASDATPEWFK